MTHWEQPPRPRAGPEGWRVVAPRRPDPVDDGPAIRERDDELTALFTADLPWLAGSASHVCRGVFGEGRRPYWWFVTAQGTGVVVVELQVPVPHIICKPSLSSVSRKLIRRASSGLNDGRSWEVPGVDPAEARVIERDVRSRAADILAQYHERLIDWEMAGSFLVRRAERPDRRLKQPHVSPDAALAEEVAPAVLLANALAGVWNDELGHFDRWPTLPDPRHD